MLNRPRVQNIQQMGLLSECGHEIFVSSAPSPASTSSLSLLRPETINRGGSEIWSATELDPVLDTIDTGLEFREEANELGSEGKFPRDL